ncbi:MAG: hypothetical protein U0790_11710 [Isosphaeraceae bacterium]
MEENLALDEALLVEADEGRAGAVPVLGADGFAVVLGASRRIARDVNREACEADGVPIVRLQRRGRW